VKSISKTALFKAWLAPSLSLIFCWLVVSGCGPSAWEKQFNAAVSTSKSQFSASEVKGAVLPLFSKYKYQDNKEIPTSELPRELTSLAIFAQDPQHITVSWLGNDPNALIFTIGNGFGQWGIVVCRSEHDTTIDDWHRKRLIPWAEGVFFFRE